MEWSNETILEFIDHYKHESVIWNALSPDHKNRDVVFDAWKRIERQMNNKFSIKELKKKKDSLMASFRTWNQKVKASSKSGAGSDDIYMPTWFAYKAMSAFLSDKDRPTCTINTEAMELEDGTNNDGESGVMIPEPGLDQSAIDNEALVLPSSSSAYVNSPSNKKRKATEMDDLRMNMKQAVSILKSVTERPQKKKSICTIFGEFVAGALEAMSEETRDVAMHNIHNVLFEAKRMSVQRDGKGSNQHTVCDHDYTSNVTEYVTIELDQDVE